MSKITTLRQPSFSAKLPPIKRPNSDYRSREYLTPKEVDRLMAATSKQGRYGHRDSTLILMMYRHGLRASEAIALRWDMFDLVSATLHVNRLKNGTPSIHPLRGLEIRALKKLKRDTPGAAYLFITERGGPMTDRTVRHIVKRAGELAKLPFPVHPHMLRHACGHYLANNGQDTRAIQLYLGHSDIRHTTRYTELTPARFKNFWKD